MTCRSHCRVGRQELRLQKTNIKDLIDGVLAGLKSEVCEKQIEWKVGELPSLECDRGLIKQVLTNLVGDSVKYTRPRDFLGILIFRRRSILPSHGAASHSSARMIWSLIDQRKS